LETTWESRSPPGVIHKAPEIFVISGALLFWFYLASTSGQLALAWGAGDPQAANEPAARRTTRARSPAEPGDDFTAHFESLHERVEGLPPILFVLVAEDVSFGEVLLEHPGEG
jgi:hypothetical protein